MNETAPPLRRNCAPRVRRARQAGAASLVVLLMLLGASLLLAAWSQRHVMTELRIAGNQVRRAAAFEAAEAGLAWAQAMLNQAAAVGADCRPAAAAGSTETFRARYLDPPDETGRHPPRPRSPIGTPLPRQMLCAHGASSWRCDCPGAHAASLGTVGDEASPSYLIEFATAGTPGAIDVIATGCNHLARPCLPGASDRADAVVRLRVTLALLPAVLTPPAAALTARGDIDASAAALGVHNADAASGGLAAHAGGRITGSLRVQTAPGAPRAAALLGGDTPLASLDPTAFFARHFGIDRAQWALQPGVHTLACPEGACNNALRTAVDSAAEVARIAVPGDLRLDGPVQIGQPQRPVVLVVDGALVLSGAVELHGLVHARRMAWDDVAVGNGGLLHGAVLLDDGYAGNGAPDLVRGAALLRLLQQRAGTWVRVPGSWRDF